MQLRTVRTAGWLGVVGSVCFGRFPGTMHNTQLISWLAGWLAVAHFLYRAGGRARVVVVILCDGIIRGTLQGMALCDPVDR